MKPPMPMGKKKTPKTVQKSSQMIEDKINEIIDGGPKPVIDTISTKLTIDDILNMQYS